MTDADKPTLYVCHGDEGGPSMHPCRRVQAAMKGAGIDYDKVIAGPGRPFGIGMKGKRDELEQRIGVRKLPALRLPDGTVIVHSPAILRWVKQQRAGAPAAG